MSTQLWTYRVEAVRTVDLTGFEVDARDGPIGRVDGATNEVDVSFIVVDAVGQLVLLPAGLVETVDPDKRKVVVTCSSAEVRGAPHFHAQRDLPAQQDADTETTPTAESRKATARDLYDEARRLDIPGRSKMTKSQLSRALSRAKQPKASPLEVQAFLEGVGYPAGKHKLLDQATKRRASAQVRATIERLPDRRFENPTDVSRAIGELY